MNGGIVQLNCAICTPRRQQEVGQSTPSFHSLPNIPPLRPASVQHSHQRPQTGPETAPGCPDGRPRHWGSSAHLGCHHPPQVWTSVPTGRGACLSPHTPSTAHSDWLSHAGSQDRQHCAHCWGQCRSSYRLVQLVPLECNLCCSHCFSEITMCTVQEMCCQ